MFSRSLATLFSSVICTLAFASASQAHEFKLGEIQVGHPFARATVPGQTSGGAFLSLENRGKVSDKLVKAESTIAKSVELHSMEITSGDVMKMRKVDGMDLHAGERVNMQPGGKYHIMLIDLAKQLTAGDKFPLTLTFEKAGQIDVVVNVEANAGKNAASSHDTKHQH